MILGDFNARTNTLADFVPKDGNQFINDMSETSLHPKIRQNFDTTINNHGKHLINICKNTDLRILNGRTKGDSLGRPTFHGKNGINSIDYIICDQETFQNVNHLVVKQPAYLSDHSQLIAWIDIYQPTLNTSNVGEQTPLHKLPLKFEWSNNSTDIFRQKLKSTEIQKKLNNFTQSTFSNDQDGINECMMQFQDILIDASKKSLKLKRKKFRRKINNTHNKKWFDKECRFQRHEVRKLANKKHRDPTNINLRNEYHTALKTYKETLENKKEQFENDRLTELERAAENDPNSFWKVLQNSSDEIENGDNKHNSPKGDEWFNHFSKLHHKHKINEEHHEIIKTLEDKEKSRNEYNMLDTEITEHEIQINAKKLKLQKAVYSDKIKNEMIKCSTDILAKGYIKLFNAILNAGSFPQSWCEGLITPIFKSGNKQDPNNYRGICISSSLGKFFCAILNNRLMNYTKEENIIHPSQIGFMPGNRTADHILTLKTLHDNYIKPHKNKKIYACFIDFKKAFDSIWHDGLLLKLLENKIGGRFYDLIKNLYANTQCAVKIDDHRTSFFPYTKGVRQGCVLSPILFNLYINELPKLFEETTNSDPFILSNNMINSLLYADDLVILSQSQSGLQNCLNTLHTWSKKWLLEVNFKKTKIMILQKHKSKPKNMIFNIGNNPISITDEYTYLGVKLTPNTNFQNACQQLSEKATHALYKIRKKLDFHKLPPKLACKIFDSVISPILLYNSEVWGAYTGIDFTKWDKTKTEKAHLKFCKLYLGVNRKASNNGSRGELGKFPLLIHVIQKTLTYIKKIYKLPDSSLAKLAFLTSKELYLNGRESFYSNVVNSLKKHFPTLQEPVDLESFTNDNTIKTIIDKIKTDYVSGWKHQLSNSSKLTFYNKIKKEYKQEQYLTIVKNPCQRRLYTKLRISNHKLLIEYGRYHQIPREERICKHCNLNAIENEFHFAFECPKYDNLRNNSNNILKNMFEQDLSKSSREDLLTHIMTNTDPVLTNLFSNFIMKCFKVRDKC